MNAIRYRSNFKLSPQFILDCHKHLLAYKPREAGRFRKVTDDVTTQDATFTLPAPYLIEIQLVDLFEEVADTRRMVAKYKKNFTKTRKSYKRLPKRLKDQAYTLFIATYFHHRMTVIHPFTDGNGRMARLLMCLYLRHRGYGKGSVPPVINSIIYQRREKYLNALNAADKGNFTPFMRFLGTCVITSQTRVRRLMLKTVGETNKTQTLARAA